MDRVRVNETSLSAAGTALKDLSENISAAVSKCETELKSRFDGIDDDYKKDLTEYIDVLNALKNDIGVFASENEQALKIRAAKINEYSATSYKRKNI